MKWIAPSRFTRESVLARRRLSSLLLVLAALAYSNSPATPVGSDPVWLGTMGNFVYFIARPAPHSTPTSAALFKTDGTTAGTTEIVPIDGLGIYTYQAGTLFITAGVKAYFLGYTTDYGQEVWVTDGTATGTHQVADIFPGPSETSPVLLGLIGTGSKSSAVSIVDNASGSPQTITLTGTGT